MNSLNRCLGFACTACLGWLSACGEPLVDPALVSGPRLLGARVEAEAAPERATLRGGETGRVRWLVGSPTGPALVGARCAACVAEPVSRGLPRCAGEVFASQELELGALPEFSFVMPDGAEKVAIFGAFCESGTPRCEGVLPDIDSCRCPEPRESPRLATVTAHAEVDGRTNRNPSLEGLSVGLGEMMLPTDEACAPDQPRLTAGSEPRQLVLTLGAFDAESFEQESGSMPDTETLSLAHYVTGGELERVYSELRAQDESEGLELGWTLPTEAPPTGAPVWFFFVLRDGRGGLDWTLRQLCVEPG